MYIYVCICVCVCVCIRCTTINSKKSEKNQGDFPGSSAGKETAYSARDLGSIPGLGRSPGEGNSYPLQYSGLENSIDCIVHGVTESRTRLGDFHTFAHDGRLVIQVVSSSLYPSLL